ncbi:Glucose-methanol-choline oxidoreductase [Penicillium expansum]|uniref:Glucose-methanol-choline oxidoreductase n=1 Tax=Penicillium expansum TaxID=27334 RepID=A0A0A2L8S4_PENEN|nr:Glucose-methanol-choline oxidoreductase [Penicillium expansum]KGO42353.1 Glucose-methanol-choline oxidoreductase [Penicillium expansum]KGO56395.1 Glucose-methanol-choline oxidoreductase [Penicillium expansum]KGO73015.1 Glucose-methanol-choline oxidoreductase [Penicillium expansum]
MESTKNTYDFVIVGGGPAGCALAVELAKTAQRPQVLLLEAGGRNDDRALRVDGKRWTTFMEGDMNWGYKTTPQEHCNGRELDYSRGKGLGGGSAINFGVYTVGARDDYNEWASIVDDDTFGWKEMQTRFKNLETFNGSVTLSENQKYANSVASDHGNSGVLHLSYAEDWEKDLSLSLDAFKAAGHKLNLDHNSGNPLGMAATINSAYKGKRTTAADLLSSAPENLVVVTDSPVQRILMQGKKAVGIETQSNQYFASRDVILSAGSLDTPKILMHSGIGPAADLEKFNIPVVNDLPAVGQGLRDHYFVPLILARNPDTNDRNSFFQDPAAMEAAMKQWEDDNTGPWTRYSCQIGCGWFKSDRITSTPEFKALPASVQEFMNRETIPHYEIITHMPIHFMMPDMFKDYSYIGLAAFMMNEQSRGEVRLQSSDPDVPLLFNPRFLEDPFDRRACIEIYRHLLEVSRQESFAKDTISTLIGPASDSDEDILQFWKNFLSSSWHMTGTMKMGKADASDAAVDTHFRVRGIENLRVADMSVVPVLTNNHTQATAYVTGVTCADVLIKEYGLDEK